MSQASFLEVRWLRGLQLLLALLVIAILMGRLALSYRAQREVALETAMQVMAAQFSASANVLHSRWFIAGGSSELALEGERWHFSNTGWPRDLPTEQPVDVCARLWLGMGGKAALDGEVLRLEALPDGRGCLFQLHGWRWHYDWQTGRMLKQ